MLYYIRRPLLLGVFILFIGCGPNNQNTAIIRVGASQITSADVETKLRIESCYRDDKSKPEPWLGLYQLIEEALMEEAARTIGVEITPAMMEEEVARVDRETKAPEILNAVKKACPDEKAYRRIYLKPRMVNRLLHYKFSDDKTIQQAPYQKALDILALARSGKELKLLDGYAAREIDLSKPKQPNPELSKFDINNAYAELEKIIRALQPGEIDRQLREDRYAYSIIKLIEKKDTLLKYETVIIKKMEFDKWFEARINAIKKEVYQRDKIEEILRNTSRGPVRAFLTNP